MDKLYFNAEELGNIETVLNQDIEELNTIFKNIKSKIDSMNSIWNGDAGDNAYTKLKDMYSFFDALITNGTSYTKFLNEITFSYISADTDNTN